MPCQFFALRLLALASQLESYLHLSIPFPLRSQRFRISRCYSHPCHSFSPQSCSVLFRFCLFACPIKSISDQRISVSFRIYSSQFSSVSVHFYTKQVLSQRLHLGATPRHSVSCRASAVSDLLVSGPCTSVAFLCSFVLLPSSLFLCSFAFLCYSTPIRFTFLLLHFAAPWLISLPLHRLPHQFFFLPYQIFSFLGGSVSLLFYTLPLPYFLTIQGVLTPYLLLAF